MNEAINFELQFFLISILWGSILLFVYDDLRILRRIVKHSEFLIALEDLFFWVIASVFIFAMMYRENNGIIRGYCVLGMAIGMILYNSLVSRFYVKTVTKCIEAILRPIRQILRFVERKGKKFLKSFLLRLKKLMKSVRIALIKRERKALEKLRIYKEKRAARKKKARAKTEEKKKARAKLKAEKKEQANLKLKKRAAVKNKKTKKRKSTANKGNKEPFAGKGKV